MKKRDWHLAREKIEEEERCRLAGSGCCVGPLAAAHTIGRVHDGELIDPDDVIPLCTFHHQQYDARQVGILEVTTYDEQAAAVAKVGIIRALKRLTSGQGNE